MTEVKTSCYYRRSDNKLLNPFTQSPWSELRIGNEVVPVNEKETILVMTQALDINEKTALELKQFPGMWLRCVTEPPCTGRWAIEITNLTTNRLVLPVGTVIGLCHAQEQDMTVDETDLMFV